MNSSAEAHAALAFVTFYWNWDAVEAERQFQRAIALNPGYVTAHHWYATFLMELGRSAEASKQIDLAQQLDPASTPSWRTRLSSSFTWAGATTLLLC